ncbi:MAG: sugar phosphate nucleotidyltransferase, partial [Candidatus Zixiibacteriota bacterium]
MIELGQAVHKGRDTVMEAVILAGGKGTRLRPYTAEIPKPLVTVGDKPIIEILLRQMRKYGVRKVHIAVNHLAHLIIAVLGDGKRLGIDIAYSHEKTALSTVGPIKLIRNLPEHFIVANGDVLTDLDFKLLFDAHVSGQAMLTVATHQRSHIVDYGVFEVGADGGITGFTEKPKYTFMVSMGIYVFSREILKLVPSKRRFGFDDLMSTLLERKERINLFPFNGYWLDIGRPEDYELAN